MKIQKLQRRIARAEALMEGRELQTTEQWNLVRTTWKDAWTPLRIVLAGAGLGFLIGRTAPLSAIGNAAGKVGGAPKLLQAISAISALVASFKADDAAKKADVAADEASSASVGAHHAAAQTRQAGAAVAEAAGVDAAGLAGRDRAPRDTAAHERPETFRDSGQL